MRFLGICEPSLKLLRKLDSEWGFVTKKLFRFRADRYVRVLTYDTSQVNSAWTSFFYQWYTLRWVLLNREKFCLQKCPSKTRNSISLPPRKKWEDIKSLRKCFSVNFTRIDLYLIIVISQYFCNFYKKKIREWKKSNWVQIELRNTNSRISILLRVKKATYFFLFN